MASTYLSRTFTSNSVSNRKFTYSFWIKRSGLGECTMTSAYQSGTYFAGIKFLTDDRFELYDYRGSYILQKTTSRKFRDINAWYHIVIASDTSVSTPDTKIYINGVEETAFDTNTDYNQNASTSFNHSYNNTIGAFGGSSYQQHVDGAITHFHFIDGTQYAASDFGETDSTTGIWKPKTAPSVTYGNNGFFLKFENSASMGTDSAGSNNWTVNGTMTQLIDTPSNIFATLDKLQYKTSALTYSNGNTTVSFPGAWVFALGNTGVSSGKYYWEAKVNSGNNANSYYGICAEMVPTGNGFYNNSQNGAIMIGIGSGDTYVDGSYSASATSPVNNNTDILGLALDLDSGTKTLKIYKNGTQLTSGGTINLSSYYNDTLVFPCFSGNSSSASCSFDVNFGNGYFGTTAVSSAQNPDDGIGIFEYSVPTGYRALCTKSINAQEYS